jgi:hypothetical protein
MELKIDHPKTSHFEARKGSTADRVSTCGSRPRPFRSDLLQFVEQRDLVWRSQSTNGGICHRLPIKSFNKRGRAGCPEISF